MKKTLILMLCCITLAAAAKKISDGKLPATVKASFVKAFPSAIGTKWELEKDGGYEAAFKQGAEKLTATFDASGAWKETEKEIPVASLPSGITSYLQTHKEGKVKEAAELKMADGTTRYEADVAGNDMIFDASGNLLTTKKD